MLRTLQTLDRRLLYALLFLAVMLPFFVPWQLPVPVSPQTRALYDTIESLPAGSFVLFGVDWAASTRGENGPQTDALMRHLMKKRLRFAIIAFSDVQGETLGQESALRLQSEYGYVEGRDWTNWGYRLGGTAQESLLKALAQDTVAAIETDNHGHSVRTLPVMQGIRNARDIALIIDINATTSYAAYIQFLQGPYKIPMGFAPTAVMAPEAFNYLDSKQMIGMVAGLQGAVEYEQLLHVHGKATRANLSSSFAHLLIMAFIVLGNVAMLLERRQRARRSSQ